MKDCCVIIPIYNKVPTDNEKISLYRNLNILTDYDIFPDKELLDDLRKKILEPEFFNHSRFCEGVKRGGIHAHRLDHAEKETAY